MIEIREGFNPEENKISISVKSALIKKYFANLKGMIKTGDGIPREAEVERLDAGGDVAVITFPVPEDSTFKKVDENVGAVGVNAEKMSVFYSVIYKFLNSAIRSEFKRVEFLTLSGYGLENLKQDVKNAIENKRNFAILHTYQEYLDSQKLVPKGEKKEIQFNQVYVNYGTELYADVAILIQQGKIKELRKLVEPLFKLTKWA